MVTIVDPQLHVEHVGGHPGERRLVVSYGIASNADDSTIGATVREEAIVTARDEHDAPIFPSDLRVLLSSEVTVESAGVLERTLTTDVHRVDLDVEQDWWRTNDGGGFEPIAEFADHLVATITLTVGDELVASASTPTLSGSWGALGND